MPRTHDRRVQSQVAMGHDWVTAIPFIESRNLRTARNRHSMVMRRSALRNHQIIPPIFFIYMWRLRMYTPFEGSIPQNMHIADKAHGLQIQFLQPDLPMSFKLTLGRYPVANIP